ncbi:phage tail fiber protein [Stenotrophomonas maltophilia]|uniref:phage tail fiber domain-containing protein n=1 Tax=Stenotrophomonas maltophilia TaxID=40324 RepID=UPI0020910E5C|nr:phage tail fiber protein [Stenotrophomonas maltophilia]MCO5735920.1 phage tail fiber protein [Stenotrophomonas maltophilia]
MTSRVALAIEATDSQFAVPFPYISNTHVTVAFNRLIKRQGLDFYWRDSANIEFYTPPGKGVLEIIRKTPVDKALVAFHNGSVLTQTELNTAFLQALYATEETRDYYDRLVDGALDSLILESGAPEAGPVIDKVIQQILSSEQLKDLQSRINDIDLNARGVAGNSLDLDKLHAVLGAFDGLAGVPVGTFIESLQEQIVDGRNALAETMHLLGAKTDDGKAWILNRDTVQTAPGVSLGEEFDAMQASIDGVNAAVQRESTVRADAVSAVASSVETLQTRVGENSAAIQESKKTTDGLSAQYMLKTDVNGYVAGFGLWNQGTSSQFYVLADKFAVVSPGYPGVVPFAVDANGVYMNNAYIRNLSVDKITGGAISAEWALNSTSGRIVLDTGAFMKVLGVGFGANRDLIEWFGPKMAIASCTRANATTYVATDGSAYFGGTLSAGVLYNAASSSSIAGDTYAVVGPFASNGRAKNVVCSYTRSMTLVNRAVPNKGFSGGGQNSALVSLYRNLNGAGEVLVAQQYVYGNWGISNVSDGASVASGSINGSFTFVDNAGASNNYVYTVRLSQLSINQPGGAVTDQTITAKLTVVSTEQ